MNTTELNVAMVRKGFNSQMMGNAIKKSHVSFNKKKYGDVPFDVNEVQAIASALSLTLEQVNEIFFDNTLQSCNIDEFVKAYCTRT